VAISNSLLSGLLTAKHGAISRLSSKNTVVFQQIRRWRCRSHNRTLHAWKWLREDCGCNIGDLENGMKRISTPIALERISNSIFILRGHRVLLDESLAELYGVETKVLLQSVKRNRERFPEDFMLQLTAQEWSALRSQIVTSNKGRGGRRYLPYAFTEQGVAMLSSVLKSPRAISVNIEVMRAFVRMRALLTSNSILAQKLRDLASRVSRKLAAHDQASADILKTIRELMNPQVPKSRPIGFTADLGEGR
jgi:hypothetical protein